MVTDYVIWPISGLSNFSFCCMVSFAQVFVFSFFLCFILTVWWSKSSDCCIYGHSEVLKAKVRTDGKCRWHFNFWQSSLARYALSYLVHMKYKARLVTMAVGYYGLPQFRLQAFLWGALPSEVTIFHFFCFWLIRGVLSLSFLLLINWDMLLL